MKQYKLRNINTQLDNLYPAVFRVKVSVSNRVMQTAPG